MQQRRRAIEESLVIAREIGDHRIIPPSLEGVAAVVAAQGVLVWAARLWGAADILRETTGRPLPTIARRAQVRAGRNRYAHPTGREGLCCGMDAGTHGRRRRKHPAAQGQAMRPAESLATPHAKSPLTYPNGLTAREVEVLRLVEHRD